MVTRLTLRLFKHKKRKVTIIWVRALKNWRLPTQLIIFLDFWVKTLQIAHPVNYSYLSPWNKSHRSIFRFLIHNYNRNKKLLRPIFQKSHIQRNRVSGLIKKMQVILCALCPLTYNSMQPQHTLQMFPDHYGPRQTILWETINQGLLQPQEELYPIQTI